MQKKSFFIIEKIFKIPKCPALANARGKVIVVVV